MFQPSFAPEPRNELPRVTPEAVQDDIQEPTGPMIEISHSWLPLIDIIGESHHECYSTMSPGKDVRPLQMNQCLPCLFLKKQNKQNRSNWRHYTNHRRGVLTEL